jgi:hypothetical protein
MTPQRPPRSRDCPEFLFGMLKRKFCTSELEFLNAITASCFWGNPRHPPQAIEPMHPIDDRPGVGEDQLEVPRIVPQQGCEPTVDGVDSIEGEADGLELRRLLGSMSVVLRTAESGPRRGVKQPASLP